MAYWLMKSEPNVFGIDDLAKKGVDHWEGVRNYQARNFMRAMAPGDQAFFYHSNCTPPGIAGLMTITKAAYPDHTAFDRKSRYYDAKSTPENPRWFMVDVEFVEKYPQILSLDELRTIKALADLALLKRGNRLSVMPLAAKHWAAIQAALR